MQTVVRVFPCSTFDDLRAERAATLEAIRRLQQQHDSMEYFGAHDRRPIETCLEELRKCDAAVVVVGHRYGTIVPGTSKSFSETEYDEAQRLALPCLVYLRDENVPVLPRHMERDGENIRRLTSFKQLLTERHTVGLFKDASELGQSVAADLSRLIPDLREGKVATPTLISPNTKADTVQLLASGVDGWNSWRDRAPGALDLSGIDLSGYTLDYYDLRGVDLSGSNLSRCSLAGADLAGANLSRVYLENANLTKANLAGATLVGTVLLSCLIDDANLEGARLKDTVLADISLAPFCSERITSSGPCIVDYRAISRSFGEPRLKEFLLRSGMPQLYVEYMVDVAHSLDPIELRELLDSTFISYGAPDESFARKLRDALKQRGVATFFFRDDAPPGEQLHRVMRRGVNDYDRVIVICSASSLRRPGVLTEIEQTLAREARDGGKHYLLPITLDDYVFAEPVSVGKLTQAILDRVIADFRGHEDPEQFQAQVRKLVRALLKKT